MEQKNKSQDFLIDIIKPKSSSKRTIAKPENNL